MAASEKKAKTKLSAVIPGGSCTQKKHVCQSCDRDGPRLPAYGFCKDCKRLVCEHCFKYHTGAIPCGIQTPFQSKRMLPTERSFHSDESGKKTKTNLSVAYKRGSRIKKKHVCRTSGRKGPRIPVYVPCKDSKRFVFEYCFKYHSGAIPCGIDTPVQSEYMLPTERLSTLSIHSDDFNALKESGANAGYSRKPRPYGKVRVATQIDKGLCWITGMVILSPDRIVITDYNNRSLKMANVQNDYITDQIRLSGRPWNVTKVNENELAVTLPNEEKIEFVVASSNELRKEHTLRVSEQYWGISNCQSKLIVSQKSPPQLQIINLEGDVLTTICKNQRGDNIFSRPHFIKTNSSFIYVSDRDKKKIFVLDYQGRVVRSYVTNAAPRGIAVSEEGTLFVSVFSEGGKGDVFQISGNGFKRLLRLKHMNDPYALCMCDEDNELYISTFSGIEKRDNFLQVYRI